MDNPVEACYAVIGQMTRAGTILDGRLRMSFLKRGRGISVWIEADQIIDGQKRKNVHLRNPATGDDLQGSVEIHNGSIEPAFSQACESLLIQIGMATIAHDSLLRQGRPTWGHNYSLPKEKE